MPKPRAALFLFAGLILYLSCLAGPPPAAAPPHSADATDNVTFQTMVSRLRTGEPYYRVFGDELRRRRYPTLSVFNWRTPLLLSSLARVPDGVGQGILVALGALLFAATLAVTVGESPWVAAGSLMQAGAILPVIVPNCLVMGEAWAGVLIGLSVCLYRRRRTYPAVILGVLALFVRELAAPYCVACTIAALAGRRWRETAAWLVGACLYGAYYSWHVLQVAANRLPTDFAHDYPALNLGGLSTLLTKVQYQAWLLVSPPWATALALTIVVAGTVAPRTPLHVRLTSAVYIGFFLVAGRFFNGYWGLVAWPTWALAFGYGLQLLYDAASALVTSPQQA